MHKTSYSALLLLKDLFTETQMQNPHSCFSYLSTDVCKSAVHRDHRSQMFFTSCLPLANLLSKDLYIHVVFGLNSALVVRPFFGFQSKAHVKL